METVGLGIKLTRHARRNFSSVLWIYVTYPCGKEPSDSVWNSVRHIQVAKIGLLWHSVSLSRGEKLETGQE